MSVQSQYVRLEDVVDESQAFAVLRVFIDESLDVGRRVMCLGGWLSTKDIWHDVVREWTKAIEYEQKVSRRQGLPPISRYHASDCATFNGEFKRENGWNEDRQKDFVIRLLGILGKHRKDVLAGFTFGACMDDYRIAYRTRNQAERNVYKFCLVQAARLIAHKMEALWPGREGNDLLRQRAV